MKSTQQKLIKLIALLLCALLVIPPYSIVASDTTTEPKEALLQDALQQYFNSRCILDAELLNTSLDGIAIQGMINDELQRLAFLQESGVISVANQYEVTQTTFYEYVGVAIVVESLTYICDTSANTDEIVHKVKFTYDDESLLLTSSGYQESFVSFVSCAYVPETPMVLSANDLTVDYDYQCTGDYAYDIVQVALTQEGYIEKASASEAYLYDKTANPGTDEDNYTKYGKWYGVTKAPWCVMFVVWCAQHANIDATVIKRTASTSSMRTFFVGNNLYYNSLSTGGSYTPKIGDLFFESAHIGIVISVDGEYMTVVDGNYTDKVTVRTIRLTSSDILGYASPAYNTDEDKHDYQCDDHSSSLVHSCNYCGKEAAATLTCSHENDSHTATCSLCDYEGSAPYRYVCDSTNHWQQCTVCYNSNWNTTAHMLISMDSGLYYVCRVCGYDSRLVVSQLRHIFYPIPLEGD